MATLANILPQPKNLFPKIEEDLGDEPAPAPVAAAPKRGPPPYGHRQNFIPRVPEDYGVGGAFPEIHVAQYPLDMGRKTKASSSTGAIVPLAVDAEGKIRYDSIIQQPGAHQIVKSQYKDLVPILNYTPDDVARPSPDEEKETTEKTKAALEKLTQQKLMASQPTKGINTGSADPQYIRYTPAQKGESFNSGASTRVIRMVEVPTDPMEPPKFKSKKVPAGPPSPPVPVMRSPPRKVTMKDQQEWKIPPCVSNWKNAKGFTIALDKRLAADGRGLQEHTINDKFAAFSESLYIAERNAREEVEKRNQIARKLLIREKEKKEDMMRRLAKDARQERETVEQLEPELLRAEHPSAAPAELDQIEEARLKRDEIRDERRRDRERDRHLESLKKKTKIVRDEERDVSEKIALGLKPNAGTAAGGDAMFDQRLFNQSSGMDSGFGNDESYNLYDKPLFAGTSMNQIYRPKKGGEEGPHDEAPPAPTGAERGQQGGRGGAGAGGGGGRPVDTAAFRPDKDFSGVDRSKKPESRSRPVEFEREIGSSMAGPTSVAPPKAADPFGDIDAFLKEAKSGSKRPLDKIGGSQGSLHAGSASGISSDMKAASEGGKKSSSSSSSSRNIEFQKGGK